MCISGVGLFPVQSGGSLQSFQFLRCRKLALNNDFLYLSSSHWADMWRAEGPLAPLYVCQYVYAYVHLSGLSCICQYLCKLIHMSVSIFVYL